MLASTYLGRRGQRKEEHTSQPERGLGKAASSQPLQGY